MLRSRTASIASTSSSSTATPSRSITNNNSNNNSNGRERRTTVTLLEYTPPSANLNGTLNSSQTTSPTTTVSNDSMNPFFAMQRSLRSARSSTSSSSQTTLVRSASMRSNTPGDGAAPPSASTLQLAVKLFKKRRSRPKIFTRRQKLYSLFDTNYPHPSKQYSKAAKAVSFVLFVVLCLSVFVFIMGSQPEYHDGLPVWLFVLECMCAVTFTLDLTLRFGLCDDRREMLTSPMAWIDFLSFIPFYVEIIVDYAFGFPSHAQSAMDVMRLLRIVRVLKVAQHNTGMTVATRTLVRGARSLKLVLFIFILSVVVFSSMMFFAEQDTAQVFDEQNEIWLRHDGTESPFQSIFSTGWWSVVTLATLGYGNEVVPKSFYGKLVAALTMYCGVLYVSFPIVLLTHHFNEVVVDANQLKEDDGDGDGPRDDDSTPLQENLSNRHANTSGSDSEFSSGGVSPAVAHARRPSNLSAVPSLAFTADTVETGSESGELLTPQLQAAKPRPILPFTPQVMAVAASFSFLGSHRHIYYVGTHGLGQLQFRYNPLLVMHPHRPPIVANKSVRVTIAIDLPTATKAAVTSLEETFGHRDDVLNHVLEDNVAAFEVKKVSVRVARLPSACYVSPDVFYRPGASLVVNIVAPSEAEAQRLLMHGVLYRLEMTAYCTARAGEDVVGSQYRQRHRIVDVSTMLRKG
eukprot:PhM_4_TR16996/c1_g1_i1/m.97452